MVHVDPFKATDLLAGELAVAHVRPSDTAAVQKRMEKNLRKHLAAYIEANADNARAINDARQYIAARLPQYPAGHFEPVTQPDKYANMPAISGGSHDHTPAPNVTVSRRNDTMVQQTIARYQTPRVERDELGDEIPLGATVLDPAAVTQFTTIMQAINAAETANDETAYNAAAEQELALMQSMRKLGYPANIINLHRNRARELARVDATPEPTPTYCKFCQAKRFDGKDACDPCAAYYNYNPATGRTITKKAKNPNRATSQAKDNERAERAMQRETYKTNAQSDVASVNAALDLAGFTPAESRDVPTGTLDETTVTIWHDADGMATIKQTPYTIRIYNGRPARMGKTAPASFVRRMACGWSRDYAKFSGDAGYADGIASFLASLIAYDEASDYSYFTTTPEDVIAVPTAPNNTPCHECGAMHYHPPMNPLRPELYECAQCHNLFCGLHCVETANNQGIQCWSCHNAPEPVKDEPRDMLALAREHAEYLQRLTGATVTFKNAPRTPGGYWIMVNDEPSDRRARDAKQLCAHLCKTIEQVIEAKRHAPVGELLTVTASGDTKPVTVSHDGPWQADPWSTPEDYTIATTAGAIIAQVSHHDINDRQYPAISGGSHDHTQEPITPSLESYCTEGHYQFNPRCNACEIALCSGVISDHETNEHPYRHIATQPEYIAYIQRWRDRLAEAIDAQYPAISGGSHDNTPDDTTDARRIELYEGKYKQMVRDGHAEGTLDDADFTAAFAGCGRPLKPQYFDQLRRHIVAFPLDWHTFLEGSKTYQRQEYGRERISATFDHSAYTNARHDGKTMNEAIAAAYGETILVPDAACTCDPATEYEPGGMCAYCTERQNRIIGGYAPLQEWAEANNIG